MWDRLKLKSKFSLILIAIFLAATILGGIALSDRLLDQAKSQVTMQGVLLLEAMDSARNYTNERIQPLVTLPEDSEVLIREIIPSYAATQVFENLRQNISSMKIKVEDFSYKNAVFNPTNVQDKATAFETSIIEAFRADASLTQQSDFLEVNNRKIYYSALPIIIREESCLRCHSTPDRAPRQQIEQYGATNGFNWRLNEVIGTQIVYIPAQEVFDQANQSFWVFMGGFILIVALVILLINLLLNTTVLAPITPIASLAEQLSQENLSEAGVSAIESRSLNRVAQRGDELGYLARIVRRMAQEVRTREQQLREQVKQLRIEIDQTKKERQVAEITETDYFRDLQQKSKELRRRDSRHPPSSSPEQSNPEQTPPQ